VVHGPDALGALPGDVDLVVAVVGGDRGGEPGLLAVGEVFDAGAQDVADPVQRIVTAAARWIQA